MSLEMVKSEAEEELDTQLKMTDLNQNVLEKIFAYLNLGDLLSIADTIKRFQKPVEWIFRCKYGTSKMIFWATHTSRGNHPVWKENNIYIDDFTLCLKTLRCFGHVISALDLNYLKINEDKCTEIDYYVIKYCTALIDITFKHASEDTLKMMAKPFEKIRKVTFEDTYLSGKLADLSKWFPRLYTLELKFYMRIENCKSLEQHFPNLENLTIDGQVNNMSWTNIITLLCFNPQLRRLHISDYFDMRFLQKANIRLHFLEDLTISKWTEDEFAHNTESVHFKNVRNLTIDFSRFCKVPLIPLRFDQLYAFTVDSVYMCRFNDNFIDFMRKNTTIRKLKIVWQNYAFQRKVTSSLDASFKEKLAQASSNLLDIDLGACIFSLHEAVSFFHKCKSLKRFCLSLSNQNEYGMLHEHLGDKWKKITDDHNCIRFEHALANKNNVKLL